MYQSVLPGIYSNLTRTSDLLDTGNKLNVHQTTSSERLMYVPFTSHVQVSLYFLINSSDYNTFSHENCENLFCVSAIVV